MRTTWTVAVALGLVANVAWMDVGRAEPRPIVVELFTSQGCSSCPPADQLLGELAHRPGVIALAFHVDYWDRLGWKDPFGLPAATARQKAYARALSLRTVYTPQMVIDGRTDMIGSDRPAVLAALDDQREGVPVSVWQKDGRSTITIAAAADSRDADVILVTYGDEAETRVARGENAGRLLKEYAIVRAVQAIGRWNGNTSRFVVESSSLPPDATGFAVLIQAVGQGAILGATTAPLR